MTLVRGKTQNIVQVILVGFLKGDVENLKLVMRNSALLSVSHQLPVLCTAGRNFVRLLTTVNFQDEYGIMVTLGYWRRHTSSIHSRWKMCVHLAS